MVRPIKGKKRVLTFSFTVSGEYEYIIQQLDHLGAMDNKSRGEMFLTLAVPYVNEHFPGNPQVSLFSVSDNPPAELPMKVQVSLSHAKKILSGIIKSLEEGKGEKGWLLNRMESVLSKAAGAYDRTKDPELLKLIERCRELEKD